MIDDLSKYGIAYPELCIDIVNYFRNEHIHSMLYEKLKQHFGEDPLRVLRMCRFASKLDFTVAPETMQIAAYCTKSR